MNELTLDALRDANMKRDKEWDPAGKITALYRSTEFAGEAGEVCNKVKKLERERLGLRGSRTTWTELALELADAQITLDLIAMHYGIDLGEATKKAFNDKSREHGFETRLP